MARFKYAMENILNIKTKIEEQKRMELGRAIAAYNQAVETRQSIRRQVDAIREEFSQSTGIKLTAERLVEMNRRVSYYERSLKSQELEVIRRSKVVDTKREALKHALEEKKIQEKLKEKALEKFVEEEKATEQKHLDEVVGYRYATKEEE